MSGLLPVSRDCKCGSSDCRKRVVMARNPPIACANDLSINEEQVVREHNLFLVRNRQHCIARAASHGLVGSFGPPLSQLDGMQTVLKGIVYRNKSRMLQVGGYDPDQAWPLGKANEKDDAVRCICGSLEEDGEMTQCDTCNFWLHSECLRDVDHDSEYKCQFCRGVISGGRPCSDVILAKQPDIRLHSCSYYKALTNNRSIQVRLNETVHVLKTIKDDHKKILKKLMDVSEKNEKKKNDKEEEKFDDIPLAPENRLPHETFHRKDLRVFRVERLFAAPGGHRFVFGFYYARPHETFCDSQRIFHRNEVFSTPLYDTLPLDAVVGRCAVLDASVWCIGRPTVPSFKEEDVYICEYQIDRNQRSFEKIPSKNRYPINTQPYVFKKFKEAITIKRDFTAFLIFYFFLIFCFSSSPGTFISAVHCRSVRFLVVVQTVDENRERIE
ncbi:unnamed protein product [Nippostrongylus brasiliensis]|uniref:Probable histone-lysine N-methyltransferase lin-59 (inferred by orthology to a C. elegans protein) n=1 Tax=Nippostrongylus brasiliensis TaxID=27835 RepID=A0A0N4YRK2_NIPBR|nr:unnamed protein product [Nippostrongylus brasiliensis]